MPQMYSRKMLTESQLAAIGCAAVESTFTECMVFDIIVQLSGMKEEKLLIFMPNVMLEGKFVILEALANRSLRTKKAKADFALVMEALRRANGGRISLVHGAWEVKNFLRILGDDWEPDGQAFARNRKKLTGPTISATKAATIAREIADAYENLHSFWFKHWSSFAMKKRPKLRAKSHPPHQNQ